MVDPANILRTVLWEGQVAGNMVSFLMEGKREVGYWLGQGVLGERYRLRRAESIPAGSRRTPPVWRDGENQPQFGAGTGEMRV